jgi:threonine/homoserine/homoserine lactone efflux protein
MRTCSAIRVFSGSTVTGPLRRAAATSARNALTTSGSRPAKWSARRRGGAHACDWLRLANRRPQRGQRHNGFTVMGPGSYLAFLGVSLLVICTPGQDTALTIRNTLAGGRRAGVVTALGVSAGQAAWTVATSAGLVVVLVASAPLFLAIRIAGAAYLIYLGIRTLAGTPKHLATGQRTEHSFAQGLLSNLSNAKMVAFFLSLLPPFAGPHPTFALLLALGLNFCLLTLVWLTCYAFAVDRLGGWLRRTAVARALNSILGLILISLGVRVGAEAIAT